MKRAIENARWKKTINRGICSTALLFKYRQNFLAAPQPAAAQPPAMWPQQPTNGFGASFPPQQPANNTFVSEANFSNVFNNTDTTGEALSLLYIS